ncbi:MAG: peptidoglycan DD-metalloendopeptidase family protein [Spirochaetia bacterium]
MKKKCLYYFLLITTFSVHAQNFQHIHTLRNNDQNFSQLTQDIMENYRRVAAGKPPSPLNIFTYRASGTDTLFSIAARLNLPYDTIATLNSIASPSLFPRGEVIFLPNMVGLTSRTDENDPFLGGLEERLSGKPSFGLSLPTVGIQRVAANFYPNQRFSPAERTTFLSSFLLSPLKGSRHIVTSRFGKRTNPFRPGRWEIHTGVDYRAPLRSPVHASRFGRVKHVGNNSVLGNFIILEHERNYESVYGHLTKAIVRVGQTVSTGQMIAESGNTGRSTGPHLHFEVRKNGRPINPLPFLRKKN